MSLIEQHDVVQNGSQRFETRSASSRLVFSPGQVIAAALGLVTAVIGIITLSHAGIDGTMNVPVVQAAGLHQSAILGLAELGLGLLLILGASSLRVSRLGGQSRRADGSWRCRDRRRGTDHFAATSARFTGPAGCSWWVASLRSWPVASGDVVRTRRTVESA